MTQQLQNPYYDEFVKLCPNWSIPWYDRYNLRFNFQLRESMCDKYAWAIPTDAVIYQLAKYSPIIEVGAGTGYWAWLLQQAGADVIAYDKAPPDRNFNWFHMTKNDWKNGIRVKGWTAVHKGPASISKDYSTRTLLLCWPPYDNPMARIALDSYEGNYVIYIGETAYGCTADNEFHQRLEEKWFLKDEISIPNWDSLHDAVFIYQRVHK